MNKENKNCEFFRYLLKQKYNLDFPEEKSFLEMIQDLDITEDIKLLFSKLLKNPNKAGLVDCDTNIKKEIDDLSCDTIFCIINSDSSLLKIFKDKNLNFFKLRNLYEKAFNSNKSFLKCFNTKDKVKKESKKNIIDSPLITRFAPEPSGCLHIGHVKALLVNYNMAIKSKGKFLLRFDDTNPIKDYEKYEKEILKDLETLEISNCKISHSSDYFDFLVEKAIFLIQKNLAYVDNTEQEIMRNERFSGIESKCRNNEISFNLEIFNKMLKGTVSGYCLRAKIDMSNNNKTMRDPVIYRCSDKSHCRIDKYKAYPTYDFVCPIIDSIEGVTVVSRADEYKDRNEQYNWFINKLELSNKPNLIDFSKLNLADTLLSKRKIDKLITEKIVNGWDDPRLSTVQGIKRLGMDMKALKEYINLQGASNKTNIISWDKIWAINKKFIDQNSPRFMAIEKNNCVKIFINNFDESYFKKFLLHKKNESLGEKNVFFSNVILISQEDASLLKINEEFTLMNWGNAIVKDKLIKNDVITEMTINLHLEGDYKLTTNKISWISELGSILVKTIEYSNILLNDEINLNSKKEVFFYAESNIFEYVKIGMHVQFERLGFYYYDDHFVFHLVPFTKQKRTY